jgi:hypothetical protein
VKTIKLILTGILVFSTACAKKTVIVSGGSGSSTARISLLNCMESNPTLCRTISYITAASTTPSAADPTFQLGVFDTFANGVGATLSCDVATTEAECLTDVRAYLSGACDNEVDDDPPIYARKYTNSTMGNIHIEFDGRTLNFTFTEIICKLSQSTIQ